MVCVLGFQELASRNPFVKDLDDQGYMVDFINGYFVIYGLPYLDKDGVLKYGDWVSPVNLTDDGQLDPPSTHQAWFRGGKPHDKTGRELSISTRDNRIEVTPGFAANYSFSCKLLENGQMRDYRSFEEKVQTYLDVITTPAMDAYPDDATPLKAIEIKAAAQNSPLRIPDTSSANYNLNDISSRLRGKSVAIIGLGGTGSYVLDFIARTHLERIALFDDDKVHVHTIFRMPGYIHRAIGRAKVEALAEHYGKNWHAGIEPFKERISRENIGRLREFDFVFVSIDDGPSRMLIVDWLSSNSVPFVDCGMGLNRSVVGLNGTVRITGVDRNAYEHTVNTPYLPTEKKKEDEYRKQAQIAELNALNAAFAVIRFKQHFELYDRLDEAVWYTYETAPFELDADGRAA